MRFIYLAFYGAYQKRIQRHFTHPACLRKSAYKNVPLLRVKVFAENCMNLLMFAFWLFLDFNVFVLIL